MSRSSIKRRRFLQAALIAAGAGTTISCTRTRRRWRVLTDSEAETLAAICEQIVPHDQDPGARDVGVVNFIDLQLTRHYRRQLATYRKGFAGINESSRAMYGREFVGLGPEQQWQVLQAMERNEAPGQIWKIVPARQFLDLCVAHTMQGFYGDPRHGGNVDGASYRMLRIPYPPVRGRTNTLAPDVDRKSV